MIDQSLFDSIPEKVKPYCSEGKTADYIPALGRISPEKFAIVATQIDDTTYQAGDFNEPFSLQSISKVFALTLAIQIFSDQIWEKVGRRLSARPFNSVIPIEEFGGLPRNPFTNEGAIAITDLLLTRDKEYTKSLLSLVHKVTGNPDISFDNSVALSEKESGHRNIGIAHFLKSYGIIKNPVEMVLETYFLQCSLAMSCKDLSQAFVYLANRGVDRVSNISVLSPKQTRHLNAFLLMFGTYDAAGDFVFKIGLPGKSGVGGGIVAIVPGRMSIAVWSPGLDEHGTSVAGMKALELLTEEKELNIL